MRIKTLLLLFLLTCGVLSAQDTIRTLVISEVRLDDTRHSYVEISNVGTTTLNLAQFEIGIIGAWTVPWNPGENYWFMLPDKDLEPGKSFVMAAVYDWNPEKWMKAPLDYFRILNKKEFWTLADIKLHFPESPTGDPTDSVTPYYHVLETWSGRDCIYLRHHVSPTDSVVVDQVNGVFANADGTRAEPKLGMDVAGFTNATNEATLVRKFSVKQGNIDFESARGQDLAESEWMPIPLQLGHWEMDRKLFWTVGNHGDYNLDENTLVSNTVDINWADSTITVPWGIRKNDSIMSEFEKKPGIAWHYDYAPSYADSAYVSARTGDVLTVYACGNDLDVARFTLNVAEPTSDANIVIPKNVPNADGFFAGTGPYYIVSDGIPGSDTIKGIDYLGIGYATRVDTMLKYMEKSPEASWEMIWVDGQERVDLKNGDKLKVTAKNGSAKEYYIKVDNYRPSHNAYLSSITWPDIPDDYRGIFGWMGDTIPNFSDQKYEYKVQVPSDVAGIPALVGKTQDINAALKVDRAANLYGTAADKTVTFTSTAEDDTTIHVYTVQLEKEKDPANLQPWSADPFISQFVWQDQWANAFMEVCNPGNQPLDMSKYMFCWGYVNNPSDAITRVSGTGDWANRYGKYIPGYKWQDETNWAIQPALAVQDLNVNPLVQGGDVFVIGDIRSTGQSGYPWWASQQCDIDFGNNPWNESVNNWSALQQWNGANWYLFRIENDSITRGLKPANNPNDFTLIDVFGSGDGTAPVVGGEQIQQTTGYTRKPDIYTGDAEFQGSFGTDVATSEWIKVDRPYFDALGVGWPNDILYIAQGIGSHFMDEVTIFKSTVSSLVYKVSPGYSLNEQIRGVVTNTKVSEFLAKILKADEGQTLKLKSSEDGALLADTDTLMNGDTLVVQSTDLTNTTKYLLEVTDEGLSDNAVLTSTEYDIAHEGAEGSVSGFPYGIALKTVVENVTVPSGASFSIINAEGAYVPLKMLNFDTVYVDVLVSDNVYFEVIAENGVNTIVYQLQPDASSSDAFVTSSVFMIDQEASLIDLIPEGTTPTGLLNNLIPAPGATMKLVDKLGYERVYGNVVKDDKLVVTAADGETTKTYYLTFLTATSKSYLAYVVSDVYLVDQVAFTITGNIGEFTTVTAFLANLTPAEGAAMKVTNASGVQNTGDMDAGDLLVVTSGDGLTIATYVIDLASALDDLSNGRFAVYPNPTRGLVTISGLESGNRIRITNINGALVLEKLAVKDTELISLEDQQSGIYFMTVSNNDNVVGRYKLILK
jgi:hypothetical protein